MVVSRWPLVVAVVFVLFVVAMAVLSGCGAVYRVQMVSVIPGYRISVSCASSASGARRLVILPGSQARSVHVGDVCPG